ncbi:hypothetical protein C0W45_02015 [Latilactobacillus curvatus]|nr:hypothetical protein C0W45_02015 [Latilactobacillus curvatus]
MLWGLKVIFLKTTLLSEKKKWHDFKTNNKTIFYLLAAITFITYSSKIILYSYSIDTELFIHNGVPFDWWTSLGRYGLAILSKILSFGISPNILLTNIITYLLIYSSAIILAFIIWRSSKTIKPFWLVIGLGLYITSPVMLEQTNFILQSIPVVLAFNSLYFAILFIQYYNETKIRAFFMISIILTIISLSVYPSLQTAFVITTLLVLYLCYNNSSFISYIIHAIPYILVLIISVTFNTIITKTLTILLHLPQTDYLNNMSVIGKIPITTWLMQVLVVIKQEFLHMNYFLFILSVILSILCLIFCIFTSDKQHLNRLLITFTTVILTDFTIGLPILLMGRLGPIRSYAPTFPLALLLLTVVLANLIPYDSIKIMIGIFLTFSLLYQIKITNDFGVSEYNQFQAELSLKQELQTKINRLGIHNVPKYKVAFYGTKDFDANTIIKGDVLGKSFFEWDAGTSTGVTGRATNFLSNEGLSLNVVDPEEYQKLSVYTKKMTVFPSNNSLKVIDNYILIKLSD